MKLVVGVTEAAGVAYGMELQGQLKKCAGVETYTVITDGARQRILTEMRWTPEMVDAVAGRWPAETPSNVDAVILAPCSVERLATLTTDGGGDWLSQTAATCLKEHKPVIVLVTQPLLKPEQLELMLRASRMGATVLSCPGCHLCPVSPSVMSSPAIAKTLELVGGGAP